MQITWTLQEEINFDLEVKSGQLLPNDHTGTSFSSGQPKSKVSINCWQWKTFFVAPLNSHLSDYDPLWPKLFPLLIGWKGTRAEQSTPGERKGVCMQPTAAVPMVPLQDLGQTKAPLWASLSLYLHASPARATWGSDWEAGSQESKQHLLSPWKSALSFCPPGSMCLVVWGRGLRVKDGHPLQL